MARTPAHRKYQLTFNNPQQHGYDHERIKAVLTDWPPLSYWCMCDEEGTCYHTHLYLVFPNAVIFTTLKQRFYGAHIEPAQGTNRENRDYIRKEGKWADSEKKETNLSDTFEESGELPADRGEAVKQTEAIYAMVKEGADNATILEAYPSAMNRLGHIEQARQTLLQERYKDEFRNLHVTYLYGAAGVGKTRSVMEKYGYSNVYRVTNYDHPFDNYKGQNVIIFEEFRSSLPISDILNYLDGYPLSLPCRYADKFACYTEVYIISNISLEEQYPQIQIEQPNTWKALMRRIHKVYMLSDSESPCPFN